MAKAADVPPLPTVPAAPALDKTFPIDGGVLAPGSAVSLQLSGATDMDVALAVATNAPFPARPNGQIDLVHLGLKATGNAPLTFSGGQVSVTCAFDAGVTAAAGIFDDPANAVKALNLADAPGLDLAIAPVADTRYALLTAGYTASGSVSGTHPIGAIGTLTFGVTGAASGMTAVLHRFPKNLGADTVLKDTVTSWKLPRHIDVAAKLTPSTWLIAEADGSLAVNVAAALGYNFNFVRDAKVAGLSGDIGLKIDAAATATFGFQASGRYLVVVGREQDDTADQHLRVRMFKLSSNGLQFGLNLKIGVTGVAGILPDKVDDFVKAVFGTHGVQIVKALQNLERWTDPNKSVGELVAGLVNEKALDLIRRSTGIDPATAFEAARAKLLDAIHVYENLPDKVSSTLWSLLGSMNEQAAGLLKDSLNLLGSTDESVQKAALVDILNRANLANSPIGQLLDAAADHGLLDLLNRLPDVRRIAGAVLSVLNGDVIRQLQVELNKALSLDEIFKVINEADFNTLDSLLVGRLAAFFDRDLHFSDLNDIKNAINLVIAKRKDIYDKARKALTSRYGFDLSSTWQRTTASTALIDATFDTASADGRALLAALLQQSAFDRFLTTPSPAVQLKAAVLTHEITRKTTLDLALPHFNFQTEHVNSALARVSAEDDGARVLVYDATGQDVVTVRNKFRSSLAISVAAEVSRPGANPGNLSDLRIHSTDANSWSYQLLHAKAGMKREELEAYTRPFIQQYMADQFTGATNLSAWYAQFDRTVENIVGNGPEEFGDVCASFEVAIPGRVLGAWCRPITDTTSAARQISKAIQQALKQVVPFYYLTDIEKLKILTSSAALLTWSAIRPSNGVRLDGGTLTFDVGDDPIWDVVDPNLREAMGTNQTTIQRLVPMLAPLRLRLEEAGRHDLVQFYQDNQAGKLAATAVSDAGDPFLRSLLLFESSVVRKATDALDDIQQFAAADATTPSKAIARLADFAADITLAFNKLIGDTVFAGLSFRAVSQSVFVEASRVLDAAVATQPQAMLTLTVLQPAGKRQFNLPDFLTGAIPDGRDVAVAQRLVRA